MHMRSVVALAVVALSWWPGVSSAITEKVAVGQVKAAAKARLGLLHVALDGARTTLVAEIDAFDASARNGGFATLDAQALADDLAAFQAAVQEALFDVAVGFADDGRAALAAIDGGPLTTIPIAFANLPGGVPDRTRASIAKLLARTYRPVNKRLVKTSKLVGSLGVSTLFAVLDPPPQLSFAFTDLRGDAILFDFAIDLRMSAAANGAEGRLWVGGTAAVGGTDLVVSAVPMDTFALSHDQPVTTAGRGRFLVRLGDTATLTHTNYLVGAVPVTAGFPGVSASSSFALR